MIIMIVGRIRQSKCRNESAAAAIIQFMQQQCVKLEHWRRRVTLQSDLDTNNIKPLKEKGELYVRK